MEETCYCANCEYVCNETLRGNVLCKIVATSILADLELLEANTRLQKVAENGENKFFLVENTNSVIFHIRDQYCILVDYIIENTLIILPNELKKYKFYISRQVTEDKNPRDWTKTGSKYIHYLIREIVYGCNYVRIFRNLNCTINHEAETYDERLKNSRFVTSDKNRKSHRLIVDIKTMGDLDDFIDDIQQNEGVDDGIYFDKQNEKKRKTRPFVK